LGFNTASVELDGVREVMFLAEGAEVGDVFVWGVAGIFGFLAQRGGPFLAPGTGGLAFGDVEDAAALGVVAEGGEEDYGEEEDEARAAKHGWRVVSA
jgi:hypothetical protein